MPDFRRTCSTRPATALRRAVCRAILLWAAATCGAQTEFPGLVPTGELDSAPYNVTGAIRADFVEGGATTRVHYGSASVVNHPQVAMSVAHVFNYDTKNLWSARQWYRPRARNLTDPYDRGVEARGVIAYTQYTGAARAKWDAVALYGYEPFASGLFGLSLPEAEVEAKLQANTTFVMAGFPSDADGNLLAGMSRLGPLAGAFTRWPSADSVEWYRWGQAPRSGMSGGGLWAQTAQGWRFAGMVTAYGQSGSSYCAVIHPYQGGTVQLLEEAVFQLVPNGDFWRSMTRGSDGWRVSGWLGPVNTQLLPWIWHDGLGFVFAPLASDTNCWLYLPEGGWIWTRSDLWPNAYSQRTGTWFHFRARSGGGGWWYDYARGTWVASPGA